MRVCTTKVWQVSMLLVSDREAGLVTLLILWDARTIQRRTRTPYRLDAQDRRGPGRMAQSAGTPVSRTSSFLKPPRSLLFPIFGRRR